MRSEAGGGTEGVLGAAGWYPDSSGVPRWWDGQARDMAKRGSGQERTWALLSHLCLFVMPLVPAIVLRVTVGRRDRFTRHHTTEALNAQIWFVVIWNALMLPLIVTSWDGGNPSTWAFFRPNPWIRGVTFYGRARGPGCGSGLEGRLVGVIQCPSGSCQGQCESDRPAS
jgi:hypothetical protein